MAFFLNNKRGDSFCSVRLFLLGGVFSLSAPVIRKIILLSEERVNVGVMVVEEEGRGEDEEMGEGALVIERNA